MTSYPPPPGWSNQPPPAQPPGPPPPAPSGFLNALFDFKFSRFVTPSVVRALYILGFAAVVLIYLVYLVIAFSANIALGFVVLLVGWVIPLLYLTFWRVLLEFFVAVIRMSEDIHHRGPTR